MTPRDVEVLNRRLRTLTRAADRIRAHASDLHTLGWEPQRGDTEKVNGGTTDHTPRAGDPRARHLWDRILLEVGRCEDLLVGLERDLTALFYAHSNSPEPSRGSLISAAEHAELLAKQQVRPDTSARLVDQPAHPGRQRGHADLTQLLYLVVLALFVVILLRVLGVRW